MIERLLCNEIIRIKSLGLWQLLGNDCLPAWLETNSHIAAKLDICGIATKLDIIPSPSTPTSYTTNTLVKRITYKM
ncbi:hypothetical protein E2C01_005758 [Portunus trituberculatus]|uniref:Uncharacterized protein n=1 Tax=Portunus trituberculatus TaxID=210409 RepID=A0A5B7CU95_PORTR|nr:hypothetical protein [Portunus trituberculatus]